MYAVLLSTSTVESYYVLIQFLDSYSEQETLNCKGNEKFLCQKVVCINGGLKKALLVPLMMNFAHVMQSLHQNGTHCDPVIISFEAAKSNC